MKIAIITAGGAGMFCGSCMQDNTLARALRNVGHDVTLVPTYTPITVDEENVSGDRVFLGGVNVYLDSAVPGWSRLPRFLTSWLDRPGILNRLTRHSSSTDARQLGPLAVDMLRGNHGPQRKEIRRLVTWLVTDLKPDLIVFSNALLSGIVPSLRHRFQGPIVCLLQGDDIFLDALPDRWRQTAIDHVRDNSRHFDRLFTHSRWYADHLSASIGLSRERFDQIPLSIDCELPEPATKEFSQPAMTVGYFARICPEKGAENFLDAVERLADVNDSLQFRIAGYLPELHGGWFRSRLSEVQQLVGPQRLQWLGSPKTREDKFRMLQSFDLLCVPAVYREPKGIFVLEAALMGVPSLVPDHGAFPERIDDLGYGWTYPADSAVALDEAILRSVSHLGSESSARLRQTVREKYSVTVTGPVISGVFERICR
jgi:glycosyltransferase involved in cell wall biosynthesis